MTGSFAFAQDDDCGNNEPEILGLHFISLRMTVRIWRAF